MRSVCLLAAFSLLAALHSRAANASISVTASAANGIAMIGEKKNSWVPKSKIDGRLVWKIPASSHQLFEYFEVQDDSFKDGGHPSVVFTIDYFDQGIGPVVLTYDSLAPDKPGTEKKAGVISLGDSKTWKQASFAVTDARFDARCNDYDFRTTIPKNTEFVLGGVTIAPSAAPPSTPWVQAPQGTLLSGTFTGSRIFPNSVHPYVIYIPKQYDPSRPACVYVGQDGLMRRFASVFNRLIYEKQMPVTVGMFIKAGTVMAPSPKTEFNRSNRTYEYDSIGDEYPRFLLEEFIPYVAKTYKLNLSQDPNDHAIGGASSGGICAFNAAWQRPDGFRRVYSSSGSFLAYRGGDILPLLVRKYEAKPIRVFMYVGTKDVDNFGGVTNAKVHELDRALKFAGYDDYFQEIEGGHTINYAEGFEDGMKWLWRGWPAPVVSGSNPPSVNNTLLPGEPWRLAGDGYHAVRGMTVNPRGEVFFSDTPANTIYKVGTDGKVTPFSTDAGDVCGLSTGTDGRIYGISDTTGNLLTFDPSGQKQVIATGLRGHAVFATRQGGFYVTVPGAAGTEESQIWYVSQTGEKKLVDTGLKEATGIADSTDDWQLYVADGRSHYVYAYQINPDGSLTSKEHYFWLYVPDAADDSGVDGLAVAANGNLYAATRLGIQVSDFEGHNGCVLPLPAGRVTSLAFGGPDFDVLYAGCGSKVFARKVKVQGLQIFHSPTRPSGHGL